MPEISVIVPVYNVERYISKCLHSILDQSYNNFELIIVEDQSTDASLSLTKEILQGSTGIPSQLIIHEENKGLSAARNTGIGAARGKYLLFVDSDDWIERDTLRKLVETAEREQADIVFGRVRQVYENDARFDILKAPEECVMNNQEALRRLFHGHFHAHICKSLIAKKLFDEIKFPEGLVYEDVLTLPYLLLSAQRVYFLDDIIYNYLQRTGSITKSFNSRLQEVIVSFSQMNHYFEPLLKGSLKTAYQKFVYLVYHVIACHAVYFAKDYEHAKPVLLTCRKNIQVSTILKILVTFPSRTIASLLILRFRPIFFYRYYLKHS